MCAFVKWYLDIVRLKETWCVPFPPLTRTLTIYRTVYMDGAFDMFHAGHVESFRKAKALGDYLIVGIFNDGLVNNYRGSNYPILNMVCACVRRMEGGAES